MSPFARLGIFVAGSMVWAAIGALWIFVSPAVAIVAAIGGLVSALVATLELQPEPSASSEGEEPEEARDELATGRLRMRPRREIERDADRARRRAEPDGG